MKFLKDIHEKHFRADDIRELYIYTPPTQPKSNTGVSTPNRHYGEFTVKADLYESGWYPGFQGVLQKKRQVADWYETREEAVEALARLLFDLRDS